MTFLEEYEALATSGKPPAEIGLGQVGLVLEWVIHRTTELFAELREHQPVFVTPFGTVATLYDDVVEIMDRPSVFSCAPYGAAMIRNNDGLNFILGRDEGPELERDMANLHLAVRQSDLEDIRSFVDGTAQLVIDDARPSGRLELSDGFGRLVPIRMASWYFGVPAEPAQLMGWTRAIFTDIFLNLTGDAAVTKASQAAGAEFRAHVDSQIAAEHGGRGAEPPSVYEGNVLKRLVAMQAGSDTAFTDREVQNNLIGCITGVADNTVSAVVNIIDHLLDHPTELAAATAAARAGDSATVGKYVWEAMRFGTPAPFLVRVCTKDYVLAKGTDREATLKAGSIVFAANASAMMDPSEVDDPETFDPDRPRYHHMHFGWGIHECLGRHISGVQLPELIRCVLALPGLRRAAGEDGHPKHAGPFPASFYVEFDA